jgi:DnaK suppressor protein
MDHLRADQIAELRRLLEEEREQLHVRQASESEDASTVLTEPGDMPDHASDEERRTLALRRRRHDDARLHEVEAALRRMADGTYGICEETGDEIPFARLRAEPTTRYTVEAQELVEQDRAREEVTGRAPGETDAY